MSINTLLKVKKSIIGKTCMVVGDAMLDRYIYGAVNRISPEAPIPIVSVEKTREDLGGAANVAANIRSNGCKTILVGAIGEDSMGRELSHILKDKKINIVKVSEDNRPTITKTRIVGKGQQIVRFDEESTLPLLESSEEYLINQINNIDDISVIVISDYKKGVCTPKICESIINNANEIGKYVIVDPKGTDWNRYKGAFLVTPNWKEFTEIVGPIDINDDAAINNAAHKLINELDITNLLITRSELGMTLVTDDEMITYPTEAREVADVSGAGDTVIATLAAFLSSGQSIKDAAYWSNRAAGLAVERAGTSVIGIDDLITAEKTIDTRYQDYTEKVFTLSELLNSIDEMQCESENDSLKKVFTNGCFDLIHTGHIQYLNEAKKLGDYLIVGLNSDESVRRLNKGPERPINKEEDRALQLAALQMVDAVVIFNEDTPYELLSKIKPDILVKGGDYAIEDIVGREFAKETRVIPFKEGYSTTNLINKMRG